MLVLQRKIGESIFIGDSIEVVVIDASADKVKLAIKAPRSVSILRAELKEAVSSNQEASHASVQTISELQKLLFEQKDKEQEN